MLRRSSRKQSSAMDARPHASASDDPFPAGLLFSGVGRGLVTRHACKWLHPNARPVAPRGVNLNE